MGLSKLSNILNNISKAQFERYACCLDADPGSYCWENDSRAKKCEQLTIEECRARRGEGGGIGSYCGNPDIPGASPCCDDVSVGDIYLACCYGNPKECHQMYGPAEIVERQCREYRGEAHPEKKCKNAGGTVECRGPIDPKP